MSNTTTDDILFGADEIETHESQRPRDVTAIIADWNTILSRLEKTQPKVAEGPFRWPHHGCFTRHRVHVELPLEETWQEIDRVLTAQPEMVCPCLIESCRRHAWEAGKVLSPASMDILRSQLDAEAQGRMLAGASDRELEWVAAHLDGACLTTETLMEIATHACRRRDVALLTRVLQMGTGLMDMTLRRMEPLSDSQWSDESHWADRVARLSHRVADMLLETALVRAFPEGVELALAHGADPNIKLWRLERSFNAWHTATDFPLTQWGGLIRDEKEAASAIKRVTDLLIQHPAFVKGGRHFPALMEALEYGRHDLCERLLTAGATFQSEDKPEWTQKTMEGGDVDWSRCYWLWPKDAEAQTAQQLADAVPLIPASEASWLHSPHSQGGTWHTPLSLLLKDKDLPHLIRYAAAGLPLKPTYQDCLMIMKNHATECLRWLLEQWQVPPAEHPKLLDLISK